jgi:hypothetical protein
MCACGELIKKHYFLNESSSQNAPTIEQWTRATVFAHWGYAVAVMPHARKADGTPASKDFSRQGQPAEGPKQNSKDGND